MDCVPSFDLVSPMFLSDFIQEDEMSFLNNLSFQEDSSICNLTIDNVFTDDQKRKGCKRFKMGEVEKEDGEVSKKIKHRDVERQRRQELSTLLKSLRCLLPLDYIKGKRSASDHVQEAANYIKDLQNKIKELDDRKENIKRLLDAEDRVPETPPSLTEECCSSSSWSHPQDMTNNNNNPVVVMPCLAGVEVVIRSCLRHKFCLSRVLQVLIEDEGFNVVRCISSKLQGRFIHTIVCEVDEGRKINFSEVGEKIMKANI